MYANFIIVVAVVSGAGVICAAIVSLYRMARKIDEAMNKQCPCETVTDLQDETEQQKKQIEENRRLSQELDKRLSIAETEMRGVREAVERIDRNVMKILTKGD